MADSLFRSSVCVHAMFLLVLNREEGALTGFRNGEYPSLTTIILAFSNPARLLLISVRQTDHPLI
jgi:hypothetical protein